MTEALLAQGGLMFEADTITAFLGWCSVINSVLLGVSTVLLIGFQQSIVAIHAKLFGVNDATLEATYIRFLGHYKLLIIVFNVVPYLALKLMA